MDRKELMERAGKLNAECAKLEGKELEGKTAEFDGVIAAIKQHDELAALKPGEEEGKSKDKKTPDVKVIGSERDLERHFMDAIKGKSVPDRAMDEFQHRNPGFKEGKDALKLPASLAKRFLLPGVRAQLEGYEGKAIPTVSTDDPGPANTFQLPIERVLHAEAEPPRLMEMVTSIPAPLGGMLFPRIVQTDDNEYGAIEVTWGSEAGSKEETELAIEQITLVTHEVRAYTEVSDTALRRSVVFEPWLTRMFREATADAVETAIAVGDGVTQPEGISVANIREILRAGVGIQYADLVNLKYALRNNHRRRGVFIVQDTGLAALELLQGAVDNRPIFTPSTAEGLYPTLVGRPYVGSHRMPALNVEGDIVFMDPSAYVLAVETDILIRRSEHFKFRNNVTAFSVFMLVGGRVVLPRLAVRLEDQGASSTSDT